jgi:hypothetical protein
MATGKDIENRNWTTRYRGRLAIHASAEREPTADLAAVLGWPNEALAEALAAERAAGMAAAGVILGTVELVDCVRASSSRWFFGPHGFVLRNPRPLARPIAFRGRLGLWLVPREIEGLLP